MVHDLKCKGPGTFLSHGVGVLRMQFIDPCAVRWDYALFQSELGNIL